MCLSICVLEPPLALSQGLSHFLFFLLWTYDLTPPLPSSRRPHQFGDRESHQVCNHPNLFTEPPVASPFVMSALVCPHLPRLLQPLSDPFLSVDLVILNFSFLHHECNGLQSTPLPVLDPVRIANLPLPVGAQQVGHPTPR